MKSKIFIFLAIFYFGVALPQTKEDWVEVEKINQYSELIDKDSYTKKSVFQVNEKEKYIKYTYWKKGNEIVKISREWNEIENNYVNTYTDYFLLRNNERVYASESIVTKNKYNAEDIGGWSVSFWIDKNEVTHMTSLGHGKTEDENWNFKKELDENFNYMIKKVQKNEKEIKTRNGKPETRN